jgi:hypothetical protein
VQDNVLPALLKTLCKAQGINKKRPELIAGTGKATEVFKPADRLRAFEN